MKVTTSLSIVAMTLAFHFTLVDSMMVQADEAEESAALSLAEQLYEKGDHAGAIAAITPYAEKGNLRYRVMILGTLRTMPEEDYRDLSLSPEMERKFSRWIEEFLNSEDWGWVGATI
jgi:hypothetical protein